MPHPSPSSPLPPANAPTTPLCLSRSEIAELARTRLKTAQLAFLRANGIRHYVDARGWPVVTRGAIEGMRDKGSPATPWKSELVA